MSFEWAQLILSLVSPILLALLAAYISRREKDRENEREDRKNSIEIQTKAIEDAVTEKLNGVESGLKQEFRDVRHEIDGIKADLDGMKTDVANLHTSVDRISSEIDDMESYDNSVLKDLKVLSSYHEKSAKYINELGTVVMTLAEGMRDQHLDGNITSAVAAYRAFEHEQFSQFISTPEIQSNK